MFPWRKGANQIGHGPEWPSFTSTRTPGVSASGSPGRKMKVNDSSTIYLLLCRSRRSSSHFKLTVQNAEPGEQLPCPFEVLYTFAPPPLLPSSNKGNSRVFVALTILALALSMTSQARPRSSHPLLLQTRSHPPCRKHLLVGHHPRHS